MQCKISVIVPIYNVEEYIIPCLDSLVNQTLKGIEVIMVNDGTKDRSAEMAQTYADQYENFFLYNKENGGLGPARNYGVQYATGEYIAFLDSDDVMAFDAYEKLYEIAKRNDSDIAVGNVLRFNSEKTWLSYLHLYIPFHLTVEKTTLSETPLLVYDMTAWNKIYKASFWRAHDFQFPPIQYEDAPVTIPAHYLSARTSIIPDTVYYWRVRDGMTQSITQRKNEINNLTDRLKSMRLVDAFFDMHEIDPQLYNILGRKIFDNDIPLYFDMFLHGDEDYQEAFIENASDYLTSWKVPESIWQFVSPEKRLCYFYIMRKDKEGLKNALEYISDNPLYHSAIRGYGDTLSIQYPGISGKFLIGKVAEYEQIKRVVDKVQFSNDGIEINGYAFKRLLNYGQKKNVSLRAFLVGEGTKKQEISITIDKKLAASRKHGKPYTNFYSGKMARNYTYSGFKINLPFTFLKENKKYKILVEAECQGVPYSFCIGGPTSGKKSKPAFRRCGDCTLTKIEYTKTWDLVVNVVEEVNHIKTYSMAAGKLLFEAVLQEKMEGASAVFYKASGFGFPYGESFQAPPKVYPSTFSRNGDQYAFGFDFNVLIDAFAEDGEWSLGLEWQGNITPFVVFSDKKEIRTEIMGNRIYQTCVGTYSAFNMNVCTADTIVSKIRRKDTVLSLSFSSRFPDIDKDMLTEARYMVRLFCEKNGSMIDVPVTGTRIEEDTVYCECAIDIQKTNPPLISGLWRFSIVAFMNHRIVQYPLIKADHFQEKWEDKKIQHRYNLYSKKLQPLSLSVSLKKEWISSGNRKEYVMRSLVYPMLKMLPMKKNRVVFQSYWGNSASCNPLAIYEYLDSLNIYDCVWLLKDELMEVPGKAKKVRNNSLKYYYHMATARFFVNNVNFPDFHKKRKGAVEVQTMHGTPLKSMGFDVKDDFPTPKKKEAFRKKIARWDYVISPSSYVSTIIPVAFQCETPILEVGYPRNDYLFKHRENKDLIEKTRERLGIPKDKKVIMYAPTWRTRKRFTFMLDIESLKSRFSDEYVLLLRMHSLSMNKLSYNIYDDFLINGNMVDDIRDLYLISDVLITDFSSAMFDYAILERPIVLYTYDYDEYTTSLRGTYFDLKETFPNLICMTNEEVVDALAHQERLMGDVRHMHEKFNDFEKGNASEQLYSQVFLKK